MVCTTITASLHAFAVRVVIRLAHRFHIPRSMVGLLMDFPSMDLMDMQMETMHLQQLCVSRVATPARIMAQRVPQMHKKLSQQIGLMPPAMVITCLMIAMAGGQRPLSSPAACMCMS